MCSQHTLHVSLISFSREDLGTALIYVMVLWIVPHRPAVYFVVCYILYFFLHHEPLFDVIINCASYISVP